MRTLILMLTIAGCQFANMQSACLAVPPGQAYHRTPGCIDGNCIPNRGTNGYHATRWRPWPGGEPSFNKQIPPIGIEPKSIQVPSRDDELDVPFHPNLNPDGAATQPSPNDKSGPGITLPPDLQNLTPQKPVEETRPGSSSLPRGPIQPGLNPQPLLLGKKPEPLRLRSADTTPEALPAAEPPMLKIRAPGNSTSSLTPEMVPWNDEDRNPVVRQAIRITGNQVQETIRLDESALPDANENRVTTIRVQHEITAAAANRSMALSQATPSARATDWHSSAANAPAILPNVEAQPLQPLNNTAVSASSNPAASPLRGISQGNPLRR